MFDPKTNLEPNSQLDPLLRQAINNNPEALEELFSCYRDRLYRVAFRVTRDADEAEDALQDGLLIAYRNLSKFEGRSHISTWLTRIVINASLMRLRRRQCLIMISIDRQLDEDSEPLANKIPDSASDPEETLMWVERIQTLKRTLKALRPIYRDALWLRVFEGMSYSETAEILGVPIGSLKAQLHRARRMLCKGFSKSPPAQPIFERTGPEYHLREMSRHLNRARTFGGIGLRKDTNV